MVVPIRGMTASRSRYETSRRKDRRFGACPIASHRALGNASRTDCRAACKGKSLNRRCRKMHAKHADNNELRDLPGVRRRAYNARPIVSTPTARRSAGGCIPASLDRKSSIWPAASERHEPIRVFGVHLIYLRLSLSGHLAARCGQRTKAPIAGTPVTMVEAHASSTSVSRSAGMRRPSGFIAARGPRASLQPPSVSRASVQAQSGSPPSGGCV